MKSSRFVRAGASVILSSSLTAVALGQTSTFTGLTAPAPGTYVDGVLGVNAAGSVVVGYSYKPTFPDFGDRSFRWRRNIGFDNPGPSQGEVLSFAYGVSADGNVIAGNTGHAQFGDQEAWIRVGDSRGHVGSPPGHDFSSLAGVSADGRICVGWGGNQSNPNSAEAAYYRTDLDAWTNLGFLPGGQWSKAIAASNDGSTIVGGSTIGVSGPLVAFVWTSATGMQPVGGVGNLPGGEQAMAVGVSADGSVIVGTDYVRDANFNSTLTAWRWTAATGMAVIATNLYVGGVSPDGQVIVGTDASSGGNEPAIWDAAHGLRNLRGVLEGQGLAASMSGWSMCCANAINQSGSVFAIAGEGGDPAGYIAGWVATLPSLETPCPGIDANPPELVEVPEGQALTLSVSALGSMPLTYQWRRDGADLLDDGRITGTTSSSLHIAPAMFSDTGAYDVVVTNACGTATSDPAAVYTICGGPPNGDMNADLIVDGRDVSGLVSVMFSQDPDYPAICHGDFTQDGSVDVADVPYFVAAILAGQ